MAYAFELSGDSYLNPLTAKSENFIISDESGNEYKIQNVYYTPISGDTASSELKIMTEEVETSSYYTLTASNVTTIDGEEYNICEKVSPKIFFASVYDSIYVESACITVNGENADFTEGKSDYNFLADFSDARIKKTNSEITMYAVVIRDGRNLFTEYATHTAGGNNFSMFCTFKNYEPKPGDYIKMTAFEGSQIIPNSGYYVIVR